MTEAVLAKAKLIELKDDFSGELDGGKNIDVQFNPETVKLAFANEIVQPEGGDQAAGTAGRQFVGAGSTTLTITLWFDVTGMVKDRVDDVRRVTKDVIYFMTPKEFTDDPTKLVPPAVRFVWGSLLFDGMLEGLEENLEFFSPEGKPLRASMALSFGQQKILVSDFAGDGKVADAPGRKKLTPAKQGDSVQQMTGDSGKQSDWQNIAAANNIEDPLRMSPGKLIDLNAGKSRSPALQITKPRVALTPVVTIPNPKLSIQ